MSFWWSDYIWQLAYIPTKRADTLISMVELTIDDLSQILKYGFRLIADMEPCLSYTQSLNTMFDISADRLQETLSSQLIPEKKISNWQLTLTSRKLTYEPDDSRRKSIRHGSGGKPLNDKCEVPKSSFYWPLGKMLHTAWGQLQQCGTGMLGKSHHSDGTHMGMEGWSHQANGTHTELQDLSDFFIPCWPRAIGKEVIWLHYPAS